MVLNNEDQPGCCHKPTGGIHTCMLVASLAFHSARLKGVKSVRANSAFYLSKVDI